MPLLIAIKELNRSIIRRVNGVYQLCPIKGKKRTLNMSVVGTRRSLNNANMPVIRGVGYSFIYLNYQYSSPFK
jgi:hypothetical protein